MAGKARWQAPPKVFTDARTKAQALALEAVVRDVVGVPEGEVLMSAMHWRQKPEYPASKQQAWRALLCGTYRSLNDFNAGFVEVGLHRRDYPKSLRLAAAVVARRQFVECLFEWSRLLCSRLVEVVWSGSEKGLGLRAKTTLHEYTQLDELVGRLIRISALDLARLKKRNLDHAVVHRTFGKRPDGTPARSEWSVCVGPLALINGACKEHANVQTFIERTAESAAALERQRAATDYKRVQVKPGCIVRQGEELLVHYGDGYNVPCAVCGAM